jgi:hypothetical protein
MAGIVDQDYMVVPKVCTDGLQFMSEWGIALAFGCYASGIMPVKPKEALPIDRFEKRRKALCAIAFDDRDMRMNRKPS